MGFALIIMLLGNELNPNPLLGAASRGQTYVSIASINCLSIEPHKVVFDRNEYWNPKLPVEIADRLGIKTVLSTPITPPAHGASSPPSCREPCLPSSITVKL